MELVDSQAKSRISLFQGIYLIEFYGMPDNVLDDFNGFYFPGIQLFGQLQDAGRIDVFEPVGQFIQGAGSRFIAESMQGCPEFTGLQIGRIRI